MAVADILASEFAQLTLVGILLLLSIAIGQRIYQRASTLEKTVERHVTDRKRPHISYVLYDIAWAPAILGGVAVFVRIALKTLPETEVLNLLATGLDYVLIAAMIWFATRVIREIIEVAGER